MKHRHKILFGLIIVSMVVLVFGLSSARAASCSYTSGSGWYPAIYNYSDSYVSLQGKSQICWEGETYKHRGYSYGAANSGGGTVPLNQIRSKNESWESTASSSPFTSCHTNATKDSGWKYNKYSVWSPDRGYIHYQCSGGSYHWYIGKTTHYFGNSTVEYTGNK
jgi:hypothetical protein